MTLEHQSLLSAPSLDLALELARQRFRVENNPHLELHERTHRLDLLLRIYHYMTPAAKARCDFAAALLALGEA